jgi:hypothetical protein
MLPYSIAERGLVAGQNGGFLGASFDPLVLRPAAGALYEGVSPLSAAPHLALADGLSADRLRAREQLLDYLDSADGSRSNAAVATHRQFQHAALDLLADRRFAEALDLESEPAEVRARYGPHICGQSVLAARRLSEAGVPLVTVVCAAGDLNGSIGAHWDHHFQIFPRLARQLMPPLDQASAALVEDLAARGTLSETLVLWLTEFGRSPAINPLAGRDHWPDCYSVVLAGAGIEGATVYGRSDRLAARPESDACQAEDILATVFHALGIDAGAAIPDPAGRAHRLVTGQALRLW